MLLDSDSGPEGFHDVFIENLAATPTWRSRYISPGDVTSLPPTMAEGCIQDYVTALEGSGTAPSFRSSSTGLGVSA